MRLLYSRHLEHFLAVYEAQSLRKAAEASGVTQPALSKSLRVLESALSVSLFERRASGVVPTQAAEILRRHGQHIINSSRYIEMEIAMLRGGQAGTLRIGSGMVWSATRMPSLLADLHARFPQLEVTLQTGVSELLTPRLLDGQLDVVFASLPREPLSEGFATLPLPDAAMAVFCRGGHPLARRRAVTLEELSHCGLVGFADDAEFRRHAEATFGAAGLPAPRIVLRSSSLETLLATVRASESVTILSELLEARAADTGLVRLRLAQPLWRISMGISYRVQSAELVPVQELLRLAVG